MKRRLPLAAAAVALSQGLFLPVAPSAVASTPGPATTTYYVDCTAGNDANSGLAGSPWKTVARADQATLGPGESLLFRRGCAFTGQRLNAKWTGTAAAPVSIGAYGTGARPVIKDGPNEDVYITGAWEVLSQLSATVDPTRFTSCGEPLGSDYGFNFGPGAHNDTVRWSEASHEMAGIHLSATAHDNRVERNLLTHNNMMTAFHADPSTDLGAWGVLVDGDHNDIGWNTFESNIAVCSNQGYQLASNSVELYTAVGNVIHDNVAYGDRVFSELGSSRQKASSDNVYAYNVVVTADAHSRFITTRGPLDERWGPVDNTVLYHNSTYQTGLDSQGIVCGGGCSPSILTADSNIIWADTKAFYSDEATANRDNVFWSTDGRPVLQTPSVDRSTIVADPMFVAAPKGNLRLEPSSPALGAGTNNGAWTSDVYGVALPAPPTPLAVGAAQ